MPLGDYKKDGCTSFREANIGTDNFQEPTLETDRDLPRGRTPIQLFIITIILIFIGEALIMIMFEFLPDLPGWVQILLDASILSIAVFPALYTLMFKPLLAEAASHKRAADDLQKSKKYYQELFTSIVEGIAIFDPEGKILTGNPALAKILGHSGTADFVGRKFLDYIDDAQRHDFEEKYCACNSEDSFQMEIDLQPVRNVKKTILVSVSPRFGQENTHGGAIVSIVDITENKKARQEISRVQNLESLGILAGGIAHDFNNLLQGIIGYLSLAMTTAKSKDILEPLEEAEKVALSATDLTRQLLTFSSGGNPIRTVTKIQHLVKSAVEEICKGQEIYPRFNFSDKIYELEIDADQVSRAIKNIVLNGIQASKPGGQIEISLESVSIIRPERNAKEAERFLRISIKDFGCGIERENISKIFDPYYTTWKKAGHGLGLTAAHSIISRHSGFIEVDSRISRGTEVRIYLANAKITRTEHENGRDQSTLKNGQNSHVGPARILVMDDERCIRDVASKVLNRAGHETFCAETGDQAIEMFDSAIINSEPYHLVILDLTVPKGMGGLETIKRLIELDPEVKAIVCSGYSNDPVLANYREFGFSAMLVKPFRIQELRDTIEQVLSTKPKVATTQI